MSDIDLHKAYNSTGQSVHELFGRQEEGFFVPVYQREYTWEEENINRLFEDLIFGISEFAIEEGDYTTTFLGTTILTILDDKEETVFEREHRAQPTAVQLVVDGQQRIATIALISIQLTAFLDFFEGKLPSYSPYDSLKFRYKILREELRQLFALRLGLGAETAEKPKILRAAEDKWEFSGDDRSYGSPVAQYTAKYLRTRDLEVALGSLDPVRGCFQRSFKRPPSGGA